MDTCKSISAIYLQDSTKTFLDIKIVLHWKCIYKNDYVAQARLNQPSAAAYGIKHMYGTCGHSQQTEILHTMYM